MKALLQKPARVRLIAAFTSSLLSVSNQLLRARRQLIERLAQFD